MTQLGYVYDVLGSMACQGEMGWIVLTPRAPFNGSRRSPMRSHTPPNIKEANELVLLQIFLYLVS